MRTRFAALFLSVMLAAGILGCSKKEQTQAPPATTDQTAQQAPAQQPATATPGTEAQNAPTAAAPAATPAPAPMEEAKQEPPPPPPPPPLVVPAGTSLLVRLGTSLNTKTSAEGQPFSGTLARTVSVGGEVAIPSGSGVSGTVVDSKSPGKFKGEGVLSITLNHIDIHGVPYEIATSAYSQTIKGKGKRTAVAVGGGTGAGALIGGLAGGGKGALIGGLVGAGAGTAGAAFTGNKELEIPAETTITFRLSHSITVPRSGKKKSSKSDQDMGASPQQ